MYALFATLMLLATLVLWTGALAFVWRFLPGRTSERLAWSAAGTMALMVLSAQVLGLFWSAYTFPALLTLELCSGGALAVLYRQALCTAWRDLRALLARVVSPAGAVAGVVLLLWAGTLLFSYRTPVPGIDAVTYHLPIAVLMKQEARLGRFETRCGHVNEFPRNGQMIFARGFVYTGDERAVRPVQWLAAIAAVLALFGWMRNWGARTETAAVLAPMFLLLPSVISQTMVLWGSIDLIFHALLVGAWGAAAWMPGDRDAALRRTLVAAGLGALAVGTKSTGLAIGGLAGGAALARLLGLFRGDAVVLFGKVAATTVLLLLLFGSSQYILNARWHGNPFAPIAISIGDREVFPGSFESVHKLIETRAHAGTSSNRKALLRSWQVPWLSSKESVDSRLGGWGVAWLLAILPGFVVGIGFALYRRAWHIAAVGVLLLVMLVMIPGSWWSRFSMYSMAAGLALLAFALSGISRTVLRRGVLVYTAALSLVAGAEAARTIARDHTPEDLAFPAGGFRHSLDAFRIQYDWEWSGDRDIYLWCRENLPPDARVVYFFPYWLGTYHYFFYRRDTANAAYGLEGADSPEHFEKLLNERSATHFITDLGQPYSPWAPRFGTEVFRAGRFAVYTRKDES